MTLNYILAGILAAFVFLNAKKEGIKRYRGQLGHSFSGLEYCQFIWQNATCWKVKNEKAVQVVMSVNTLFLLGRAGCL